MGWQDRAYNREDFGSTGVGGGFPRPSALSLSIMGTCLLVYILQAITRQNGAPLDIWGRLDFDDALGFKQPWRLITYQYLHGGVGHFFFNMIGLYFFLPLLERIWGWKKTLAFFTLGGVAAGLVFGLMQWLIPQFRGIGLIGASGSVLSTIGAVALLLPETQLILVLFFVPVRIAAAVFGVYYLLSAILDRSLSDAAHLGGLAFGFLAPWLIGPWFYRRRKNRNRRRLQRAAELEQTEQLTVDRILEKVSHHGMHSLSRSEKKALQRATERQRLADLAREKQWR